MPSLRFEKALWDQGLIRIVGVDEVGMATLAGPVVAAACLVTPDVRLIRAVRDADLIAAYRSGVGSYRIAARFGISPATVRVRLRAAGVRLRAARSIERGPTAAEVTRMRATGLTVRELARHYGVSHVTILDRLKKDRAK